MTPKRIAGKSGPAFLARMSHMGTATEEVKARTSPEDWARHEEQNRIDGERFRQGGVAAIVAHEPDPVAVRIRHEIKARADELAGGEA